MTDQYHKRYQTDLINIYWSFFPNMRLGQFISNALPKNTDLFYIEDADLIKALENFVDKHADKENRK